MVDRLSTSEIVVSTHSESWPRCSLRSSAGDGGGDWKISMFLTELLVNSCRSRYLAPLPMQALVASSSGLYQLLSHLEKDALSTLICCTHASILRRAHRTPYLQLCDPRITMPTDASATDFDRGENMQSWLCHESTSISYEYLQCEPELKLPTCFPTSASAQSHQLHVAHPDTCVDCNHSYLRRGLLPGHHRSSVTKQDIRYGSITLVVVSMFFLSLSIYLLSKSFKFSFAFLYSDLVATMAQRWACSPSDECRIRA
jgi:hypothetical protein